MENKLFKALIVDEVNGQFIPKFAQKSIEDLPQGNITIKVAYSGLNYKDALSFRGHKGITKKYPHTPGIDVSGVVIESDDARFPIGTKVIVTGYDLGMNTSGGFQEYVRVPSDWVVKLPAGLNLKQAMIYGTAGFTSALAIHRLQQVGINQDSGKVLVTGATGAVGILATSILCKLGYEVEISTGKEGFYDLFNRIGVKKIWKREEILDSTDRPLLTRKWKAVIENVGGETLNSVIRQVEKNGAVIVIGNVTGDKINTTVYPFILRGIALLGVESAETKMDLRLKLWEKLSNEWKIDNLELIHKKIFLDQIIEELQKMLRGEQSKKVLVELDSSLDQS